MMKLLPAPIALDHGTYRGWTIVCDTSTIRCLDPDGRESLPLELVPQSYADALEWIDAFLLSRGDLNLFYLLIGFSGSAEATKFRLLQSPDSGTAFYEIEHASRSPDGADHYKHLAAITAGQDEKLTLHLNTGSSYGSMAVLTPESALALAYLLRLSAEELLKRRK